MSAPPPPAARSAPTRFVVLGSQRSGTSVTQAILEGHPEVAMPWDETEADLLGRGYRAYTFGLEAYRERQAANRALFDALAGLHAGAETRAIGVKVALDSLAAAVSVLNGLLEHHPETRVVYVVRDDLLAQFASLKRAEATGTWHLRGSHPDHTGEPVKLVLPADEFRDYALGALRTRVLVGSLAGLRPLLEVSFERDLLGGALDPATLFRFLGVAELPVTWATMRKVAPPVEDYVENVAELRAVLDGLPAVEPAEVEAGARAALVADARAERRLLVLCQRALAWRSCDPDHCAAELAQAVRERCDAEDRPLQVSELLLVGAVTGGRGLPDAVADAVAEMIAVAADSRAAEEWALRACGEDADRALELAEGIDAEIDRVDRVVDALIDRALRAGIDRSAWPRCLHLAERSWERLLDLDLAERRLGRWREVFGEHPGFRVLRGLVRWFAGDERLAREDLEAVAGEDGPAAERAREILEQRR